MKLISKNKPQPKAKAHTIRTKARPSRRRLKVKVATTQELVEQTLRRLEEHIERNRKGKAFQSVREESLLKLTDDKGKLIPKNVHYVTNGACHRPDLYFQGGKACDYCALYPECMAKIKRLKDEDSQPPDKVAEREAQRNREEEESRQAAALEARRNTRIRVTTTKTKHRQRPVIRIIRKGK